MSRRSGGSIMSRERKQLSNRQKELLAGNTYVESVSQYNIKYTKEFYREMYRLTVRERYTAVKAYDMLGFSVQEFGADRAKAAAKEAKVLVNEDGRLRVSPGRFNGSIPPENMGPFADAEEELAYYKARSMYLEVVNRAQKKTQSRLEGLFTE